jgi:DNA mismatch repair protein MutL
VPVSYAVSPKLKERMNELQSGVEPVGIRMEWSKEDKLLIRTIPIKAPYLDIRLFVESVITLESLQLEQLIQVISQCQRFDFKLLSVEERMELNRFLLSVQHQGASSEGIYKILSVDDCRMLLHV